MAEKRMGRQSSERKERERESTDRIREEAVALAQPRGGGAVAEERRP